jgi:hypothetical protein
MEASPGADQHSRGALLYTFIFSNHHMSTNNYSQEFFNILVIFIIFYACLCIVMYPRVIDERTTNNRSKILVSCADSSFLCRLVFDIQYPRGINHQTPKYFTTSYEICRFLIRHFFQILSRLINIQTSQRTL